MTALTLALLLGGFVALVAGGELLVRGGSGLARAVGISPLVTGLTVVAFATSAPELAVTLGASLAGNPGLAVGNVVGSNIANVLLVLGASALVLPLAVRRQVVRVDAPVVVAFSAALLLLALDGRVSRLDGALLLGLLVAYVAVTVARSRRAERAAGPPAAGGPAPPPPARPLRDVALVAVGVVLLVVGAQWLVSAARDLAAAAGVSDLVIGLTVVAIGTSLPELATSVVAALRGERELALGNVVGSNLFNIGAVMGGAATLSPGGVPVAASAVRFDIPVMVAVALVLLPVAVTGFRVARWEGGLLLGYYAAYVGFLVLGAAEHEALEAYSLVVLGFVVPITALALVVLLTYELGLRRGRRQGVRQARGSRG